MVENDKDIHTKEQEEELPNQEQDNTESGGAPAGDSDKGAGTTGGAKPGEKTFTQAQVTRMMVREKNQGRAAALKELGIDPKDTKMQAAVKAYLESQKTPEQKDAEAQAAQQSAVDEANQRAAVAEAKAEAMLLGIKATYVDDAVALALSKVTDGADVKTILGELKAKYPIWFEAGRDDEDGKDANKNKGTTGQRGTGSSVKQKDQKGKEQQGMGTRLAARRSQNAGKKSSYWSH